MKWRIPAVLMLLLTAWLLAACFGEESGDNTGCRSGSEGCSCTDEATCDAGLACVAGICVASSDDGSDTGGDGDDDDDPPDAQVPFHH